MFNLNGLYIITTAMAIICFLVYYFGIDMNLYSWGWALFFAIMLGFCDEATMHGINTTIRFVEDNYYCPWLMFVKGRNIPEIIISLIEHIGTFGELNSVDDYKNFFTKFLSHIAEIVGGPIMGVIVCAIEFVIIWFIYSKLLAKIFSKM